MKSRFISLCCAIVLTSCKMSPIEGDVTIRILKENSPNMTFDTLKRDLLFSKQFSNIEITGESEQIITIAISPEKISRYGIRFQTIKESIENQFNTPIPWIEQLDKSQLVIPNSFLSIEPSLNLVDRMSNMHVEAKTGALIPLSEITTVKYGLYSQEVLYNGEDVYEISCNYKGIDPKGDFEMLDSLLRTKNLFYKTECMNVKGIKLFELARNRQPVLKNTSVLTVSTVIKMNFRTFFFREVYSLSLTKL